MTFLRGPKSSLDLGGAEIVAYHTDRNLAAVIDGGDTLSLVSFRKGHRQPRLIREIQLDGDAQSVAINRRGLMAVAISSNSANDGRIAFYALGTRNSVVSKGSVAVGNLPDSISFSDDGSILVSANEGEPNRYYGSDDGIDPPGSISIVRIHGEKPRKSSVKTLDFSRFSTEELRRQGLRISGENQTPALDLEPEFVSISDAKAFITLQENNGIAVVDLNKASIKRLISLGLKDWSQTPVDTDDRNGAYTPTTRSFQGLRMADGIDSFRHGGSTYLITANEGDGRVRPDEVNFEAPLADGTVYSFGTNRSEGVIAELNDDLTDQIIFVYGSGDIGNQGNFEADQGDELFITLRYGAISDDDFYSDETRAGKLSSGDTGLIQEGRIKTVKDSNDPVTGIKGFGARSFSIFDQNGGLVYDSGNLLDEITNAAGFYDDTRSDDKSIEPESVLVANIAKRRFAFIGLERAYRQASDDELGTFIPVFEISKPTRPRYLGAYSGPDSLSPEGLAWVPDGRRSGFLLVANEVSGTLDSFRFSLDLA